MKTKKIAFSLAVILLLTTGGIWVFLIFVKRSDGKKPSEISREVPVSEELVKVDTANIEISGRKYKIAAAKITPSKTFRYRYSAPESTNILSDWEAAVLLQFSDYQNFLNEEEIVDVYEIGPKLRNQILEHSKRMADMKTSADPSTEAILSHLTGFTDEYRNTYLIAPLQIGTETSYLLCSLSEGRWTIGSPTVTGKPSPINDLKSIDDLALEKLEQGELVKGNPEAMKVALIQNP